MIDSFERDTLQYYTGATGDYSINSERASDGSRSLYTGKNGYQTLRTYEGDGLEPLPAEGDTVQWQIYPKGNQVTELNLAYEGGGNRLVCALDSKRDEAYVSYVENSSWDNFLYATATLPQEEWLTVTLDWGADERTFTLTVDDAAGTTLIETTAQSEDPVTAPDTNSMAFVVFGDAGAERWVDAIQILDTGGETAEDGDEIINGVPQPNSDGPFGLYDGEIDGFWAQDFADDFDGGSLDTSKWGIGYGWGRVSDGKLEYVRDSDVWVDADTDRLVLRIDRDDDYTMDTDDPEGNGWYSGVVHSQDRHYQQHGYWEACISICEPVEGVLPAFWSKPNNEDWPPEIDFMERTGNSHGTVHTIHYDTDNKSTQVTRSYDTPVSDNFYVFGCHWTPDYVEWYVNGEWVGQTSDGSGTSGRQLNYGEPYYMMISTHLWPGQDWLGGDPDVHDGWPYYTEVDWVRVWSETEEEPPEEYADLTVETQNEDDNAVSGATVTIERTDSGASDDGFDWPISSETTFSDGVATTTFSDIPVGTYNLEAAHPDYETTTTTGYEHTSGGSRTTLTLSEPTYDLEITVVDEAGDPIAGATVGGDIETGQTNSTGVYTVAVPDGDYTVAAEADEYQQNSIEVTVNGAPVSQTITLQSRGPTGADYWDYTDLNGEIDFDSIPTGTYRIEAELDGYENFSTTVTHDDTGSSETIRLVPSTSDPPTGVRRVSWSRASDWDASGNARSGVANEVDYFDRYDDDTLRLGFDPDHRPLSWSGRAWWPLSDMSAPVTDLLGDNDGTVNGATLGQGSVLGTRTAQFEGGGTGDNITIPATTDLAWSGSFTIHALVKKQTTASPVCVIKNGFNEPGMVFLELRDNGRVSFGFYNSGGDVQYSGGFHEGVVGTDEWHHIIGLFDASQSQLRVYVDDINSVETLSVSGSRPEPPVDSQNDWGIGQRISNDDRDFAGYISNVGLFDTALSETAVEQLLDATQGGELTTAGRTI